LTERRETTARRDQLIAAAKAVIKRKGLKDARTRDVTDHSGVGTGLLNHYFSWNQLRAQAWAELAWETVEALLPQGLASRDRLDHFLNAAFSDTRSADWRLWADGLDMAAGDHALAEAAQLAQTELLQRLESALREGCASGDWAVPDPAGAAQRLLALHDGLVLWLLAKADGVTPELAAQHLFTLFAIECAASRGST
jgi:AcrR family transcriptional regulator